MTILTQFSFSFNGKIYLTRGKGEMIIGEIDQEDRSFLEEFRKECSNREELRRRSVQRSRTWRVCKHRASWSHIHLPEGTGPRSTTMGREDYLESRHPSQQLPDKESPKCM